MTDAWKTVFAWLRSPSRSLSSKLSLVILLLAAPIFILSMSLLYTQSRSIIRSEAVGHATSVLGTTMQRLQHILVTIETATESYGWLVSENLQPDSLLKLSRAVVSLNANTDGCSISMEPNTFPEHGRYYSVYTIRRGDSIISTIEEPYEYFERVWYKTPRQLNAPCWVDFYDDVDTLTVYLDDMIASYCKPIYDANGQFVAVISTDVTLGHLFNVVTSVSDSIASSVPVKHYPHSYLMMTDKDGRYIIHPDTLCRFKQTIFSGVDPGTQPDVISLGHEMTKGNSGNMSVVLDGVPCMVVYQSVPGTNWSLALVCPDSDIWAGYHRLNHILLPILLFGLVFIQLLCRHAVANALSPLGKLLEKTQSIIAGNMEVHIQRSQRQDAVGRLQNSFGMMLQRLNFHMGSVRYTTEQARQRNEELAAATRKAEEADRQRTVFLQNVTHQIRTPLNIIMGFAQLLGGSTQGTLSKEELKSITGMMKHNSKTLNYLVNMLFASSDSGLSEELNSYKHEEVACNQVARESISYVNLHFPDLVISFSSDVDDKFCIHTSRVYLMRSLIELLYNSAKYSDRQHIQLHISLKEGNLLFVVQDTGKGIAEEDIQRIFTYFGKVDDLSEGLGLGLPLVKRHISNLGGTLTLDEDYHAGARFCIRFPLD